MGPDSELPNEKIVRELPREKSIHGFVSAISFEEASERELQYQRSMKMMLMRPSVDNNILPASPNALKPNPVGMKRKATSPSHPQKALQAIQDQILLHGETADRQAPPCQLQSQQSSPQQPNTTRPPPLPSLSGLHPLLVSKKRPRPIMETTQPSGRGFADDDEDVYSRREGSALRDLTVKTLDGKAGEQKQLTTPRSKCSATEQRRRSKINDRTSLQMGNLPPNYSA